MLRQGSYVACDRDVWLCPPCGPHGKIRKINSFRVVDTGKSGKEQRRKQDAETETAEEEAVPGDRGCPVSRHPNKVDWRRLLMTKYLG
jgi:hypothetical protein